MQMQSEEKMQGTSKPFPKRIVTVVIAAGAVALAVAGPISVAGANYTQVTTSSEGIAAKGMVGNAYFDLPWNPRDRYGHNVAFAAQFVIPQGEVVSTGSSSSSQLDTSQPLAHFSSTRAYAGSRTGGCTDTFNLAPTNFGYAERPDGSGSPGEVWFDVECDDGLGYDYYRVHFTVGSAPTRGCGASEQVFADGGLTRSVEARTIWEPGCTQDAAQFKVCGHDGQKSECYVLDESQHLRYYPNQKNPSWGTGHVWSTGRLLITQSPAPRVLGF